VVYEPVANNPVYDLLEELAIMGVININSVIKPYSRSFIGEKLKDAEKAANRLNKRQKMEVEFYLKEYSFDHEVTKNEVNGNSESSIHASYSSFTLNPVAYRYCKDKFKLNVSPFLGGRFIVNENGNLKEFEGGGEIYGYLGKHLGYYANVKYALESLPLVEPVMFTLEEGRNWTYLTNGSVENTEWRGGISVGWKWGDFGVYKDRPIWGYSKNSAMILSGKVASFPYLHLHLQPAKWIEFNYIHGRIQQSIFDSNYSAWDYQTGANNGEKKFFVANMITLKPWKCLSVSAGNSIVYTSEYPIPLFFMPFQFFKSSDQARGGIEVPNGQNSQLFFAFDIRILRKLQIYFTTYIDDLNMRAFWSSTEINELGWQGGLVLHNFPIQNLSFTGQYTRTNPLTYNHWVSPTTYYAENYCMGNYMRDDSQELFLQLIYKPHYLWELVLSYTFAEHGVDYKNIGTLNNYLLPFIGEVTYRKHQANLSVIYRISTGIVFEMQYAFQTIYGDIKFTPDVFRGKTNTIVAAIKVNL
jgi:hypothetical protein